MDSCEVVYRLYLSGIGACLICFDSACAANSRAGKMENSNQVMHLTWTQKAQPMQEAVPGFQVKGEYGGSGICTETCVYALLPQRLVIQSAEVLEAHLRDDSTAAMTWPGHGGCQPPKWTQPSTIAAAGSIPNCCCLDLHQLSGICPAQHDSDLGVPAILLMSTSLRLSTDRRPAPKNPHILPGLRCPIPCMP